jgi:hypothetical protein
MYSYLVLLLPRFTVAHFTPLEYTVTSHKERHFTPHHYTAHHFTYLLAIPTSIPPACNYILNPLITNSNKKIPPKISVILNRNYWTLFLHRMFVIFHRISCSSFGRGKMQMKINTLAPEFFLNFSTPCI